MTTPPSLERRAAVVKSDVSGIEWPALPIGPNATLLAVMFQLEQSQWWPPEKLAAAQERQLLAVLRHAAKTVPFQARRLREAGVPLVPPFDYAAFRRLPLMTRREIQSEGKNLLSNAPPSGHGRIRKRASGGSTGEPVVVSDTDVGALFWNAFTLRDHLWHRRDLSGKMCAIRSRAEDASSLDWGGPAAAVYATGPSALLNIRADPERQLEWLREHDPDYLISHPTNVRALARAALRRGVRLTRLKEVRTMGEVLPSDLRALCREAWNVPLTDIYSSEEVGYIALQCPSHEHYHVQSENLLVEILDDAGKPCAAGATGRVVVTTLHNFATPLLRYALGDHAEAGAACGCGRGLPVIARIRGRTRNMLMRPDGSRFWPSTPYIRTVGVAPIQQLQIVQHAPDALEARFVAERPLTPEEERGMIAAIHHALGTPYNVSLTPMSEIPRPASMKFEDFRCEIPDT
jgi:phenylacetate-CoA ligase